MRKSFLIEELKALDDVLGPPLRTALRWSLKVLAVFAIIIMAVVITGIATSF